MKAFLDYFFGAGTEIEFTNFSLAHFLPILVAAGLIFVIYRFREPLGAIGMSRFSAMCWPLR